jgi:DNA invertase Pin-like site-specific DNA recombinase
LSHKNLLLRTRDLIFETPKMVHKTKRPLTEEEMKHLNKLKRKKKFKQPYTTAEERQQIFLLHNLKFSQKEIEKALGITTRTKRRAIKSNCR